MHEHLRSGRPYRPPNAADDDGSDSGNESVGWQDHIMKVRKEEHISWRREK